MNPEAQAFHSNHLRTLVCFALKQEAAPFRRRAAGRADVDILITGVGQENARAAMNRFLARALPGRVFTCGFAGALNPSLALGDMLFETNDAPLAAVLAGVKAKPARFYCAERIVVTALEKAALRRSSSADAVEMESAVIQALCCERGIPCVTLRVVLDTAGQDLPLDFNRLAKPDLSLSPAKLALALASSPRKLPALLRLRKDARLAAQRLAEVLARVTGPR